MTNTTSNEYTFRDHLAASRTIFASERTLLAYMRTAFTMSLVGITLIKLFTEPVVHITGAGIIGAALALVVIGLLRHWKRKVLILTQEESQNGHTKIEKKITIKAHHT